MDDCKTPLLGLSLDGLKGVAKSLGMPAFAGGQMAKWLYTRHVSSIDDMTDISKQNRERLKESYTIGCRPPADSQRSVDGTVKYLFPTVAGKFVETVYIPDCPEAIARAAAGFSQEELAVNMVPGSNSQPWPAGFDPAGYTIQPFAATPAPEGTVFDLGGWKLTVVNTPGHSPDSIMLYDAEKKLLFTGDSFYPAALYVDLNSEKPVPELLAIYQKTMAELAKQFGDYTLICSHNEPFCDGSFLGKTAAALGEVLAGKAPDEVGSTGLKRYEYEGFAIITH